MKHLLLFISCFISFILPIAGQQKAEKFSVDGVEVILKPTVKEIINVSVYYRGGVAAYNKDQEGIGNLALSGAPDCGTSKYSKNQFKDLEDQYGLNISGTGTYDYGRIRLNCIKKYFDEGWNLLEEAVLHPIYDAKDFMLLQQQILSNIKRNESDPDSKIAQMAIENTFKGTAYQSDPLGDTASIKKLTAEEVKNYYYNTLLNKNKMFIVVVGNVTKSDVTGRIRKSFGQIPEKKYSAPSYSIPMINSNNINTESRNLATNYIIGVMNAPTFTTNDFVANRLALATFSNNLFIEVRSRRNLSYAPYAFTSQNQMPYSIMYVSTTRPKEAAEVMVNEIKRLKKEGFSKKEFNDTKDLFITGNYMKEESTDAIAATLGLSEILGDWTMAEEFINRAQKTTPEQMTAVFRKYVKGINWNYLGDPEKAEEAKDVFKLAP